MLDSAFISYFETLSYFGIFIVVMIAGYLIPVPEEIVLLLVGYLAANNYLNAYLAVVVSILGVLTGDNIVYWLSNHSSKFIKKVKKRISITKIHKYEQLLKEHAGKTIFCSRFIVGLRFIGPLMAGTNKVKWQKFMFFVSLATLIYVPLVVGIGYAFSSNLSAIIIEIEEARHLVFVLVAVIIGLIISGHAHKFSSH